jgi:tight adherence protein B
MPLSTLLRVAPVVWVLVMVVAAVVLWPLGVPGSPAVAQGRRRPREGVDEVHRADGSGRGRQGVGAAAGRPRRPRARQMAFEAAVAELVAALAAPLRAGVPPAVAVVAAAPTFGDDPDLGPLLLDLTDAARRGGTLAEVWCAHARHHGSRDLAFVGQAWALSELTGAPLADALDCGEQVLRARARARERLSAAAAGPRASMAVLCVLPATGPVVGAVMGVDPAVLYFSSPVATGSLGLGIALGLAAWWWSRRILRAAR